MCQVRLRHIDIAISDRGRHRRKTALGVLSALKFAAYKFQVEQLQSVLESPLVAAWQNSAVWTRQRAKEALPLPLVVLFRFEQALVNGAGEDSLLLSVLLVMAWASLRWSDMQRLDLASVVLGSDHLAGWCWRTKSSKRGMPWGCLSCGLLNWGWASVFFREVCSLRDACPQRDFVLDCKGKPLGYSGMLAQFRRCLVVYAGLSPSVASRFTLHSLKTTLLAWSSQVEVPEVLREARGHHRSATVSACVKRYSRDDINPQLSCQRKVVAKLRGGWRPYVPVDRGLGRVDAAVFEMHVPALPQVDKDSEPGEIPSDTESEAESVDAEAAADTASDSEHGELESDSEASVASAAPTLADLADLEGSWLLNTVSGCAHKSVWCRELETWVLACRPSLQLGNQYEHWTCNPCFHGFRSCGHSGCWSPC